MAKTTDRRAQAADTNSTTTFRDTLMTAASVGIMALVAPGFGLYGTRAQAQVQLPQNILPAECTDTDGDGVAEGGETIDCVSSPAGNPIDGIYVNVDDVTLNIGDGTTETLFQSQSSTFSQTVQVTSPSEVTVRVRENARIETSSGDALAIRSAGEINTTVSGSIAASERGLFAANSSSEQSSFSGLKDTNGNNLGIISGGTYGAQLLAAGGDIVIENLAQVSGGTSAGIFQRSQGGTITVQNIDSVTSDLDWAVDVDSRDSLGAGNGYGGGGADISIQDIAIPEFDHDNNPATPDLRSANGILAYSGTGALNIGADPNNPNSAIGDILVVGNGIVGETDGGTIDVLLGGTLEAGNEGVNLRSAGGNITVAGVDDMSTIAGGTGDGIDISSNGGDVTIRDFGGVTSQDGTAILVETRTFVEVRQNADGDNYNYYTGGANVSIQNVVIPEIDDDNNPVTPAVRSANGIFANSGMGSLNIGADPSDPNSAIGNIYTDGIGILARTDGGPLDINVEGIINATTAGIVSGNAGTGATTITSGAVTTGAQGAAISAANADGAGDLNITSTGPINAGTIGIYASNAGDGDVTIETGAITTQTSPQSFFVDYSAILVDNDGDGDVSVTTNGDVQTASDGINFNNTGSGTSSITTNGKITTTNAAGYDIGIYATHLGANEMTISANDEITATSTGIDAYVYEGSLTVNTSENAKITSTKTGAIDVVAQANASDVTLNLNGGVEAYYYGVYATHYGSGKVEISANGNIAAGKRGISVGRAQAGEVEINLGARVEGDTRGVSVRSAGGAVSVTGVNDLAAVAAVTENGIDISSNGGAVTVKDIGGVTSQDGTAILVETRNVEVRQDTNGDDYNYYSGGANVSIQNVSIPEIDDDNDPQTPAVRSAEGIVAYSGTGALNIGADPNDPNSAIGNIYTSGGGIYALSEGGPLNIEVGGIIEADESGIVAGNNGTGSTSVKTASVTSGAQYTAVSVGNGSGTESLTITTTGTVAGGDFGIFALQGGDGDMTIVTQAVTAQTAASNPNDPDDRYAAISAINALGADLSITTNGNVQGVDHGIFAYHGGTGAATITTNGEVRSTGTRDFVAAIAASNFSAGGMTITTNGKITAERYAISAYTGRGDLTINAVNDINSNQDDAIKVTGGMLSGAITIAQDEDLVAAKKGINVSHEGIGKITIDAENIKSGDEGIEVTRYGPGEIEIDAELVNAEGNATAILVDNRQGGVTQVAGYEIKSAAGRAIHITNTGGATVQGPVNTYLTIGNDPGGGYATGGTDAVRIDHTGAGVVDVSLLAGTEVTGENGDGIRITSNTDGTSVTISDGDPNAIDNRAEVRGSDNGIAVSTQNGDISVSDLKEVRGGGGYGLGALSYGGDITVKNIGNVHADTSSALNLDTRIPVAGGTYTGGGDISVQNVAITGIDDDNDSSTPNLLSEGGIYARSGTGAINLGAENNDPTNALGEISTQDQGIYARSDGGSVDIAVAGTITAGFNGVVVNNYGTGQSTVKNRRRHSRDEFVWYYREERRKYNRFND